MVCAAHVTGSCCREVHVLPVQCVCMLYTISCSWFHSACQQYCVVLLIVLYYVSPPQYKYALPDFDTLMTITQLYYVVIIVLLHRSNRTSELRAWVYMVYVRNNAGDRGQQLKLQMSTVDILG